MSIIQLSGVKKNYAGNYVLQGITLNIAAGQIVGYIGPNGAGKSATIKILTGIINEYVGVYQGHRNHKWLNFENQYTNKKPKKGIDYKGEQ